MLTELEKLAGTYSDFHKEAYGYRPRNDVSAWTVADYEAEFKRLGAICEYNHEEECERQKQNVAAFEALVLKLIGHGAKDRETAIRWLADAEGVDGDLEYLCYKLGLPYRYFDTAA